MPIDQARLARIRARVLAAAAVAAVGCGGQQTVNERPPETINEPPSDTINERRPDTPPPDTSAAPSSEPLKTPAPEPSAAAPEPQQLQDVNRPEPPPAKKKK